MKKLLCKIICICLIGALMLPAGAVSAVQSSLPAVSEGYSYNEPETFVSKNLVTGDIEYSSFETNASVASLSNDIDGEYRQKGAPHL